MKIVIGLFILVWIWLGWELYSAPTIDDE